MGLQELGPSKRAPREDISGIGGLAFGAGFPLRGPQMAFPRMGFLCSADFSEDRQYPVAAGGYSCSGKRCRVILSGKSSMNADLFPSYITGEILPIIGGYT